MEREEQEDRKGDLGDSKEEASRENTIQTDLEIKSCDEHVRNPTGNFQSCCSKCMSSSSGPNTEGIDRTDCTGH